MLCLCNRLEGHNINLDSLKYQKLHEQEFINDCEHEDDDIELEALIGLDHYWDIVIGKPLEDLHKFWSLKSLGIIDTEAVEERFLQKVSKKVGRYVEKLLWKHQCPLVYDNFVLAKKRLESLLKKLRQNAALLKQYSNIINEQLKNKIKEEVNDTLSTIGKTALGGHQRRPYSIEIKRSL